MALFNKLFSSNKRKLTKSTSSHQHNPSQFPFNKEQVRVLLFRECDWRGRRLLFDSSAIEPINVAQTTPLQTPTPQHINLSVNGKSAIKHDKVHIEYCDGVPYKYGRPSADYNSLGEMVFGSVAISFRGTSFKVHWLHSPNRIMCSQVFLAPVQPFSSTSSSSTNTHSSSTHTHASSSNYGSDLISDVGSISDSNSINSFTASDSTQNMSRTNPLDVPLTLSLDNDDFKFISQSMGDSSGYNSGDPWTQKYPYSSARSSLASIYSDIDPNSSRKFSIDSLSTADFTHSCEFGRFNRRIIKNLSTSFENVSSVNENVNNIIENNYYTVTGTTNFNNGLSDSCVSKLRRNSEVVESKRKTVSGDAISTNLSSLHHRSSRRPRLGIAVCITMSECVEDEMLCFCSEHMALLESMLYRLRAVSENSYINRQHFLQLMLKGWNSTNQWLVDLFAAPRLSNPVWLNLSTGIKSPTVLVNSFMQDLCSLLNTADTKDTNFFISTLLTAVLTHHLGWVGTVAPLITSNIRDNINKNSQSNPFISQLLEKENYKLSEISKSYPYNALWAQLGDLYGAITNPIKLSKTIICGSEGNVRTIERLLNMLTYFIRCSEIKKNSYTKVFDKESINKDVNQQMNQKKGNVSFPSDDTSSNNSSFRSLRKSNGMARTATTSKELCMMANDSLVEEKEEDVTEADAEKYSLLLKILEKNVMNDIPKVLAFRDSRMVQQELRIGNKSMDTGIEMTAKDKQFLKKYQKDLMTSAEGIKLTVTRPDNDGVEETIDLDDDTDFKSQIDNYISLSNLITANSLGIGAKLFWGSEPYKEGLNLEQMKHIERMNAKHQQYEGDEKTLKTIPEAVDDVHLTNGCSSKVENGGVVFVLGDNEQLVGLKTSSSLQSLKSSDDDFGCTSSVAIGGTIKKSTVCKHKYKKHSGVKFNFEKYPQIATNYMKSKNLEFSEYEVLEKGLKMNCGASTSQTGSKFPSTTTLTSQDDDDSDESDEECECCKNGRAHYLQTPSNASELEFSSDSNENDFLSPKTSVLSSDNVSLNHFQYLQTLDEDVELQSLSIEEDVKVVEVAMLESIKGQVNGLHDDASKPGFTSSLFTASSDHYIADMVLQGITTTPSKWELQLKQDLTISSHCAVLEQSQAENVAIVANVDKWDVRIISSHSAVLPSTIGANGIVGMSQLVATMLESVQTMWSTGLTGYQCLSFMESKLREMYLQSETLSAFLLETEFCTLNTLTNALNLSVNDIPLLMSIASIHSPMVTKKYGISFR